jgi:tagaturonate reductase
MLQLCRATLAKMTTPGVSIPPEKMFDLPEKILQFGTGRLLRGLPDYFIDKANNAGIFNGRIVMVKSTSRGDVSFFEQQDNLYTLCERGVVDGRQVREDRMIASVSRLLVAEHQWREVLQCARNRQMDIVISNTTEAGIELVNENIFSEPPKSFPGKLLAFLFERYQAFEGDINTGLVIVPTELIPGNGNKLKSIIEKLARFNELDEGFMKWLGANYFCNSLVDRIVTGMPDDATMQRLENELGYHDDLLIVSEVYALWAIEGNDAIKKRLSFAVADERVVIQPDITMYRELKLRLLNGTHTLTCGIAFLAGISTVCEAMEDQLIGTYIQQLMQNEIAPAIPFPIDESIKETYIHNVTDRFSNPQIQHLWLNITLNYSSKMATRCFPLLKELYKKKQAVPRLFSLGFAAFLFFMKATSITEGRYYGEMDGVPYLIDDPDAKMFYDLWQNNSVEQVVKNYFKSVFPESELIDYSGFPEAVTGDLTAIIDNGMKPTLEKLFV